MILGFIESYFRADSFCKERHEDVVYRHKLRKPAVDSAAQAGGGSIAPVVSMDKFFYEMKRPRTTADLNMGWSLVHPVRLQAQHWEHSHQQVLKEWYCEAVFRLWVVKQATQRLLTVTTPTSSCPLASTVSESILLSYPCCSR